MFELNQGEDIIKLKAPLNILFRTSKAPESLEDKIKANLFNQLIGPDATEETR